MPLLRQMSDADVERAQREADWLRHAVEELRRLSPEPSEETTLAERRSAMMQANVPTVMIR